MLILSRTAGETIVIAGGDHGDITIRVIRVSRGQVRLGFACSRKYGIARGELLKGENGEAVDINSIKSITREQEEKAC